MVFTDGLRAYVRLPKIGYKHDHVNHSSGQWVKEKGKVTVHTQSIDGLWGRLKAWLCAKHGVHRRKIPGYVVEYEWRHRTMQGCKFNRLLQALKAADWFAYDETARAGVKKKPADSDEDEWNAEELAWEQATDEDE